jgi:hypothetical protein
MLTSTHPPNVPLSIHPQGSYLVHTHTKLPIDLYLVSTLVLDHTGIYLTKWLCQKGTHDLMQGYPTTFFNNALGFKYTMG